MRKEGFLLPPFSMMINSFNHMLVLITLCWFQLRITFTLFLFSTASVALSLPFHGSTICEAMKTDAVPFLSAKVERGLWLSQGLCRLVCLENLHAYVSLRVVFSAKTLCKPRPDTLILLQKGISILRSLDA
mgnify:CR=1 FL=1